MYLGDLLSRPLIAMTELGRKLFDLAKVASLVNFKLLDIQGMEQARLLTFWATEVAEWARQVEHLSNWE